jgi:hypothetical protein
MSKLMLLNDVNALRRKLTGARGSLAAKWQHFQKLAEYQAESFPLNPALVALVNNDDAAAARFRELFEKRLLQIPSDCRSHAAQYHTWCWSIPLGRWAIAYDWMADTPAFADFNHVTAADVLIDAMYSQVYPRILARQPAGDNQIASMLLACGLIGYLFGVKRGSDPRAQRLYQIAMERGSEIAATAEAQFVGEGSGYMIGVNTGVMGLWHEFLHWLGQPFDRIKWLSCQESGRNVISPGGLLLPWDAGGNIRAFNMAGLTLLACETNDVSPLALLDNLNMWHGIDHCAWFEDQRFWTLVWWPEDAPDWPAMEVPVDNAFNGWMHPEIGGCLDTPKNRTRLAQLWDICGGGQIGGVARPNTDPNTIILEVNGSPLFLDGMPSAECRAFEFPEDKVLSDSERASLQHEIALFKSVIQKEVSMSDRIRGFAHGCIGGSNVLVINDEPWYYPRKNVNGVGTLWANLPGIRAVSADCSGHYTPYYPVKTMERTSLMIQDRYILVLDKIDAEEPLKVSWQVHTRPEDVTVTKTGAMVKTPEGPWVQVVPESLNVMKKENVPGYPKEPVGGSVRVSWQRELQTGVMATLIVPGDDEVLISSDINWSGGFADIAPEELNCIPVLNEEIKAQNLDDLLSFLASAPADDARLLRCEMSVPVDADYFRITIFNPNAGIWWNGECIRPVDMTSPGTWGKSLPISLPVPENGKAELVLVTRSDKGMLQQEGGVWYKKINPTDVNFASLSDGWQITDGDNIIKVMSGEMANNYGWDTDASWVIKYNDGNIAVLQATNIKGQDVAEWHNSSPCHAVWNGKFWLEFDAALPSSAEPWSAKPMLVEELSATKPMASADSAGFRVCQAIAAEDLATLVKYLDDTDWRVQRTAIERIGELGILAGAESLRILLEIEMKCQLYPEMTNLIPTETLTKEYAAIGSDTGSKRFRVVQALIIALHKLGDKLALPLVRKVLENKNHFYPVFCAGIIFLGELGDKEDIEQIKFWSNYPEYNAKRTAQKMLMR